MRSTASWVSSCPTSKSGRNPSALNDLLEAADASIIAGPFDLHGARGKGTSVYIRDPDENLFEFIIYDAHQGA